MAETLEHILFLGPPDSPLLKWLREKEKVVINTSKKITPEFIKQNNITFLISYGYRHILKKDILDKFQDKAINLHISYLPWNRGADPNFWSFVEGTPKGITIHYLDEGVDTGDIIAQKMVTFESENETLATTYQKLHNEIQELFKQHWVEIKTGKCVRQKQTGVGSFHKVKDKDALSHLLTDGWDTPVTRLEEYAAHGRVSKTNWG